MEWANIVFPRAIAMGAQRSPTWSTHVAMTVGGSKTTNQNWSKSRHEYDVSFAVRTADDYDLVVQHFHSVRGRAKKFPFWDALDYRVNASRSELIDDADSPSAGYQLAKTYGTGSHIYKRQITRPKSGTVAIYRLRSGNTTDITSSSAIDHDTGIVLLDPGVFQPGDVLSWSGDFYVPCSYDIDKLPGQIVDRQPGASGQLLVQCQSIPIVEEKEGR
jgi:uncharacterized protein (TIGR02217 family)